MRLKALTTTPVACTVALGMAGPAHAKSDSGNGKTQRCIAAQNGKHKGFTCDSVVDDSAAACSRGYALTLASLAETHADANGNGWVCRVA